MAIAAIDTSSSNVSPIEAATRVHNLVYLGYVVVLVLAAFFTWLAWKTGNKVQDAIRADANARIAEADSKAEVAKHRAATANEGAAIANERATVLENANLTLRGQVATLETGAASAAKDVARLQKEAADSKAAQQRVEIELAKYQERARIAERQLLELQEKLKPRHFDDDARKTLISFLASHPKGDITIQYFLGGVEISNFATEVRSVLTEAGWTVKFEVVSSPDIFKGMRINVRHLNPAPARAGSLQQAFGLVGINAEGVEVGFPDENTVELMIGEK